MIRKVVEVPAVSLRQASKKVANLDKKIKDLIKDMKDTLEAQSDPEGVGLAAPQIGKNVRLFIINHNGKRLTIINPKVIFVSKAPSGVYKKGDNNGIMEGCLSLPHYYGPLRRSNKVKISFKDEVWNTKTQEFSGFLAQIVLHEIDHLNGKIFVDRLLEQKAPLYKVVGDEWEEVEI
jgi:peptide deformylase